MDEKHTTVRNGNIIFKESIKAITSAVACWQTNKEQTTWATSLIGLAGPSARKDGSYSGARVLLSADTKDPARLRFVVYPHESVPLCELDRVLRLAGDPGNHLASFLLRLHQAGFDCVLLFLQVITVNLPAPVSHLLAAEIHEFDLIRLCVLKYERKSILGNGKEGHYAVTLL